MKKILLILFLTLSLSVNAKWSESPIGFYELFQKGSKIIDVSISDRKQNSKIITTLEYGGSLYRCLQMVVGGIKVQPKKEICWKLVRD